MFGNILIANRGEIACRVIRTARAMGIGSVAVYSDADADALHVEMADQSVRIGPAPVAESYLRGDAIIAAALKTGAQAIHPGYGFLSENAGFAEAVAAAGLTFIGPSAEAIRAMGLKDGAKAAMEVAGVPIVPGYHGADQDPDVLAQEAEKIGFPVLIKAVAGGGGKGMRRVDVPGDFAGSLASAQGEAQSAFGNSAVLIEKLIATPRHIEVQVFGDGKKAVHLFERDCSLQRRHQKVVEEAPAPGMTPELRAQMGAAAVRAAEAIGYTGAGTVEFIVDASEGLRSDRFYFMEMNTRLQVEHPVTEAITGVDLVEWQLRVAAGEGLPCRQDDLAITGHAFEARIYAEDAAAGFLPATGRLAHLVFPQTARADSGVRAGDEITPFYDPMIAKLVVHGRDRDAALAALDRALETTEIAGTVTNLGFLARLVRHQDFRAGRMDTGLIDRDLEALTKPAPAPAHAWAVAALAGRDEGDAFSGFSLWDPLVQSVALDLAGDRRVFRVETLGLGHFRIGSEDAEIIVETTRDCVIVNSEKIYANTIGNGHQITVFSQGTWVFDKPDPLSQDMQVGGGGDVVVAPMPGLMKSVAVSTGSAVLAGDVLAVMEAMKMEHTLRAPRAGIVAEVRIAAGDQVTHGEALVTLEPAP